MHKVAASLGVLLALGMSGTLTRADTHHFSDAPFGIEKRPLWTTSCVVGSPAPPLPYTVRRAFRKLTFNQPVHLAAGPEHKRWFVTQRTGDVVSFPNDPDVSSTDMFLEDGDETYSITFHPRFNAYRYVYVFANNARSKARGTTSRNRIIRYEVSHTDPPRAIAASKRIIIAYPSDGHNGGSMAFGPDGFLYIAAGDGTGDSDDWVTGQDISDLPASLIRIDVDHPAPGKMYGIPDDNPFRRRIGARPEIWAYGFRNPWRLSFDGKTGDLYVGDVGQDLWEAILLVRPGGNYGWSVLESGHDFYPTRQRGPTPILPPLITHHHTEARSITGGHVYYGDRFPELVGAYLYGDYETGKIWALRQDRGKVTWQQQLADTTLRIVSFEIGPAGRFYIVAHISGELYELVPAPPNRQTHAFPTRLSETGLFTSTADLRPAPGLIPYSLNAPLWADGMVQERYIGLPGAGQIRYTPSGTWGLPEGTVLVKTFALPTGHGVAAPPRRIETQILTRQAGEWYGYSYVWNDTQTDAELAPAEGLDRTYTVADPETPTGERRRTGRILSRTECMVCHSRAAGFVLGIATEQLNKVHDYGAVCDNQLRTLDHLGVFTTPLPGPPGKLARLADPYDETADLDHRARSYLHAQCAHCHVGSGGGNAMITLRYQTKLKDTRLVGGRPLHADFGIPGAMLVAPGDPDRSVLYQRISRRGNGQMPPLGTSRIDSRAVVMLRDWITHLELPASQRHAMDRAVAEVQGAGGVLTRWNVTGPIPAGRTGQIVARFASAESGADGANDGAAAWHRAFGTGSLSRVILSNESDKKPNGAWFGRTDVIVPAPTDVQFLGASNGTLRVWLNGRSVYQRVEACAPDPEADRFEATLRQGSNRLLVQVCTPKPAPVFHLNFRRKAANPAHERLAQAVLRRDGDPERGRKLFFDAEKGLCIKCHRVGDQGGRVGPELTGVGGRLSRTRIVESILEPSRTIAPQYATLAVALRDGRVLTGVKVTETADTLTLGGDQGQHYVLSKSEIEQQKTQPLSLMPEGLEKGLTEDEFVNLVTFLTGLTQPRTARTQE